MDTDTITLGFHVDIFLSPGDADQFEVTATATNSGLSLPESATIAGQTLYALHVYTPSGNARGRLRSVTLSRDLESLRNYASTSRFYDYEIIELGHDAWLSPEDSVESIEDVSTCYLRRVGMDSWTVRKLIEDDLDTIGDVLDAGALGLRMRGFRRTSISDVRHALRKLGLQLTPIKSPKAAESAA